MGKVFKPIGRAAVAIGTGGFSELARTRPFGKGGGIVDIGGLKPGMIAGEALKIGGAATIGFAAGGGFSNFSLPTSLPNLSLPQVGNLGLKIPDFLKSFKFPGLSVPDSLKDISLGDLPNQPKGVQDQFAALLSTLPLLTALGQQRAGPMPVGRDFAIGPPEGGAARAGSFFGEPSLWILLLIGGGVVMIVMRGRR